MKCQKKDCTNQAVVRDNNNRLLCSACALSVMRKKESEWTAR